MQAMVLSKSAEIDTNPLQLQEIATPEPSADEVRVKVHVCAMCHTDLHVIEGDLPPHLRPVVPGHQIVGTIDKIGANVTKWKIGDRVGVPWLYHTDQTCRYCSKGEENLCLNGKFTGYDANGGYAQYTIVSQDYTYAIPPQFSDEQAAPLLCAGVIGYRALRLSEVKPGGKLGMWGFGASAHITIQIAHHLGCEVYVSTRSPEHQELARQLGAKWAGETLNPTNTNGPLDSAIIFAPAGRLVLDALAAVDKGGVVACAGIYMTPIPEMDYNLLWGERILRSVANSTREDVEGLLKIAAEIPVHTEVQTFPLDDLNHALQLLKHSKIDGAGVIQVSS